jgi:hypothetical protein
MVVHYVLTHDNFYFLYILNVLLTNTSGGIQEIVNNSSSSSSIYYIIESLGLVPRTLRTVSIQQGGQ